MGHTSTMTIRLPEEVKTRLERLATATERTKAYLAAKAVEEYLEAQEWQILAIQEAVKEADSPGTKFFNHEDVVKKMNEKIRREKEKQE